MDKAIQTVEALVRRSIAPSVTFFVVFAVGELIAAQVEGRAAAEELTVWISTLADAFGQATGFFATLAILMVLGVGYGLSAVQQVLFDNRLSRYFDPGPYWGWLNRFFGLRPLRYLRCSFESEGRALRQLRRRVFERIESEPRLVRLHGLDERTDYILYEILGGIDPTDTRGFVDSAKALGVVFSSAIAVTLWNMGVHFRDLGWWNLLLAGLVVSFYWIGREATVQQYRTRALRLYVNFLAMPPERLERRLLWGGDPPSGELGAGSKPQDESST